MTKNEKLADRLMTRNANISERDSLCRTVNSRPRRRKLVADAVKDIRVARIRLAQAVQQITTIRSASDYPQGYIYQQIDQREARIAEINRELATLRNEARIERALNMLNEINSMEKELERKDLGIPSAIKSDDIVS